MVHVYLREARCRWKGCRRRFWLCRSCDRGQRYCSTRCRRRGREESLRAARRRYAGSDRGRETNRLRQQRHRRNAEQSREVTKTVTDQCSQGVAAVIDSEHGADPEPQPNEAAPAQGERTPQPAKPALPVTGNPALPERGIQPASPSAPAGMRRCSRCGRLGHVARRRGARSGRFRTNERGKWTSSGR